MGFSGAMFALAGAQAVGQIAQGYAQKAEAKYNRTVLEGQASLVQAQSEIEQGQYTAQKNRMMSTSVVSSAGAGVALEGSTLAAVIESQRQAEIDQALAKFDKDQERRGLMQQAEAYNRAGKAAVRSGYVGAFTTMMQAGVNFAASRPASKSASPTRAQVKNQFTSAVSSSIRGY